MTEVAHGSSGFASVNGGRLLTSRHYAGGADLPAIVALIAACEAVDKLDRGTSIEEMRVALAAPGGDPARDLSLWEDDDGQLLGLGRLILTPDNADIEGRFWFHIHPAARGAALDGRIIAWGEGRAREAGRERSQVARLLTFARADKAARIATLGAHGFERVRYFYTMARPLTSALPAPRVPVGFVVRPLRGMEEAADYVALENEAFREHWNYHEETVDDLARTLSAPTYRSDLDLVCVAADGHFAAYCQCEITSSAKSGFVHGLGTRPAYRGRGLGRAMLLAGLRALQRAGMEAADISVDADNPSGALRLYESAGFRTYETWIAFVKHVS